MGRLDKVTPFLVMEVLEKAQRMEDVVHMEIGEPDLDPPPGVWEHLERAIKERKYFYTASVGIEELRQKIAEHYWTYYGVDISPERVVITTGSSGAFLVVYSIILSAGDSIAIADPSYPCYKNFAHLLDINPILIPVGPETHYQITPPMLEGLNIKAVHISSPSNPTGTFYREDTLRSLCSYCDEKGIYLISDEIYHGLVYEGREHTALEFSERAIVVNGFSKFFCMPGFRLGWIILPPDLVRKAQIVLQNVFISAPSLSQYAALGAFDYKYLQKVREIYKERRDVLYRELKDVFNIPCPPEGGFYIWADVSRYTDNSYQFCMDLLEKAKVAVTPGIDFGYNRTNTYIRLAYTKDKGTLQEGARRIKSYLMM